MNNTELLLEVQAKAESWLNGNYDNQTKETVRQLLAKEDKTDLIDAFYKDLEFGTGGLRGIMGVGSNRINIYTTGAATQGLSNYLKKAFPELKEISVVIGHDSRNNSRLFAETSANIFSANGIKAYLFEDLRPTPEISYAIRELGCQSGIIITASHNPKEYNGYKAYWDDGSQIIAPHDTNIIDEVMAIKSVDEIQFNGDCNLIEIIGEEMDNKYLDEIAKLTLSPESVKRHHDLKIVYTPIHGTGVKLIPDALKRYGFTNIINIPEQDIIDGDFPTVESPNPEEAGALAMAMAKGKEIDADLVMASDPDADRLGISIKDDTGKFILVNGNQTAMLLTYYILTKWKENNKLTGNEFIVKTIVTSELLIEIAKKYDVDYYDCYTGFKWIASVIRDLEGKKQFICGGEESYGFLPQTFVRDKDAVSSCAVMAELTAWAKDNGKTLYQLIQDIYIEFGFSKEKMIYIVRKGKSGADEIREMMENFRNQPPTTLAGSPVIMFKDFNSLTGTNLKEGTTTDLFMPETSNALQFFTEDGSKVSVRPSGTEPKIKFYFEVRVPLASVEVFAEANDTADKKIETIAKDLGIS